MRYAAIVHCTIVFAAALLASVAQANSGAHVDPTEQAETLLSERYATRWATLPAAERAQFSARERQWLNVGRWQEKDACVAQRGPDSGAACLVEVTSRHTAALAQGPVAVSN